MYKILGADGKEYGPVTTEQLRQWIHEGRAGGTTQAQADGEAGWTPLQKRAEFADVFTAPVLPADCGPFWLPPVVRTLAFAQFLVAGMSALWLLMGFISIWGRLGQNGFQPGFLFFLGWIVGVISLPVRIICGLGLLRGREWARRLAVGFAILMTLYGAWGLVQTGMMFTRGMDASIVLRSPMFLISHLWSLAVFGFNIATAVLLSRPDVRSAFLKKTPVAA